MGQYANQYFQRKLIRSIGMESVIKFEVLIEENNITSKIIMGFIIFSQLSSAGLQCNIKYQIAIVIQLKNNIAALYSSRPRATKAFQKDGIEFGWQPIFDQYERDQDRVQQNLARRVPGLRYSFVHRDTWTRLNVLPAKIMQV